MNRTQKRNLIGSIVCFILSFLLGTLGMGIVLISEAYRSEKSGETINKSTILRYTFTGVCGYLCNVALIIVCVNELIIT